MRLATLYAIPVIALAAMLHLLPGAHTTLAAAVHVIPNTLASFTDWRVLYLLACITSLGVVLRRYYVAGWWR